MTDNGKAYILIEQDYYHRDAEPALRIVLATQDRTLAGITLMVETVITFRRFAKQSPGRVGQMIVWFNDKHLLKATNSYVEFSENRYCCYEIVEGEIT